MALAEIQSALARLYIDAMLRDRFFAAPLVVGEQLGLSADDARDLARIPRREIDQFAESLRHKGATRSPGRPERRAVDRRKAVCRFIRALCQRVIAPRVESRPRRRGRVCRGGPKMGQGCRTSVGHRPCRVRADLAAGHAVRPCADHADLPVPCRQVGNRQSVGADHAPVDAGHLVEANLRGPVRHVVLSMPRIRL